MSLKSNVQTYTMGMNIVEKLTNSKKNIEYHKPTLSKEELQTVLDCLVDDLMDTGSIVEKFEKELKSTFSYKHLTTTNSLQSAYHLSMLSLGIKEGDSIIMSALAPLPALYAVLQIKAIPVLVDLGKSSFHVDPEIIHSKINEVNPSAILLDHTYGCLLDIKKYDISNYPIIEDFSEALGSDSENIKVGRQGTIGICGLSPMHVITTGNGSFVVSQNESYIDSIKNYKYSSSNKRKNDQSLKFDYNMLDFQAAIGIEQVSKIGILIERKKKIAQVYLQSVMSASHETYFQKASEDQFNRFPVIIKKSFDEVERYFKSLLIGTEKVVSEPAYKILGMSHNDFPNAERLYQRGHCVPIYPNLTKDNVSRISNSIKGLY